MITGVGGNGGRDVEKTSRMSFMWFGEEELKYKQQNVRLK